MRIPFRQIAVGLLFTIVAATSLAENNQQEPLTFGYIQMPPYGYTDENGELQGYLAEVARAVFDRIGLRVRYQPIPAARLYKNIRTGETDLVMGPKDLIYIRDHAFQSRLPAITMEISAYRLPSTRPVKALPDLQNSHVLLLNGYSYGDLVAYFDDPANRIFVERIRTHESGLRMIKRDRADYLIDYRIAAETVIERERLTGLVRDPLAKTGIHFFVTKKRPGAEELMARIDRAYAALEQNNALPRFEPGKWRLNMPTQD